MSDDKILSSSERQRDEEDERTRHNEAPIECDPADGQHPAEIGSSNVGRHFMGSNWNECRDTESDASTENSVGSSVSCWSNKESDIDWFED